jgi:hypothetical protein
MRVARGEEYAAHGGQILMLENGPDERLPDALPAISLEDDHVAYVGERSPVRNDPSVPDLLAVVWPVGAERGAARGRALDELAPDAG